MQLPTVLLLGRTNVGKSSLFNRLVGGRIAIADRTPHTTRDLQRREVRWRKHRFTLVDSGGFDIHKPDELHASVLQQVERAVQSAAAIVVVAEYPVGLRHEEKQYLAHALKRHVPVVLAVNKVDAPNLRSDSSTLVTYRFSGVPTVGVSAKNGGGTGDLLDAITDVLGAPGTTPRDPQRLRIVLIGRTNVGKSALTNAILHDDVRVVSGQPHTTRDAAAFPCTFRGTPLTIVDTAGVRAKGRTASRIEALSLRHTLDALAEADVACLVYSAPDGVGVVEKTLAGEVARAGKALLIVANQWDRVPDKTPRTILAAERAFRRSLPFIQWAPFLATSAPKQLHVHRILQLAIAAGAERNRTIPQADLDQLLGRAIRLAPGERRQAKIISRLEQTGILPPTFTLQTSKREALPVAYQHVVENAIRKAFSFSGTPVRVRVEQPFAKSL